MQATATIDLDYVDKMLPTDVRVTLYFFFIASQHHLFKQMQSMA